VNLDLNPMEKEIQTAQINEGANDDAADVEALISRYSLLMAFSWSSGTVTGDVLATFPVTIYGGYYAGGVYYPSVAGYIGRPFDFWKAKLKYKVIIPVSVLSRGTLQVVWYPDSQYAGGDPTHAARNIIYEVEGTNTLCFTVEPSSAFRCFRKNWWRNDGYVFPLTVSQYNVSDSPMFNGYIVIRVVNPLMGNVNSTTLRSSTMGSVWVAASDLELGGFCGGEQLRTTDGHPVWNPFIVRATFQGVGDQVQECEDITLVKGEGTSMAGRFLGKVGSVRALMQVFSFYTQMSSTGTNPAGFSYTMPVFPNLHHASTTQTPFCRYTPTIDSFRNSAGWTFFGYYACLFVGIAGSVRWKMMLGNLAEEGIAWPDIQLWVTPINSPAAQVDFGDDIPLSTQISSMSSRAQGFVITTTQSAEFVMENVETYNFRPPTAILLPSSYISNSGSFMMLTMRTLNWLQPQEWRIDMYTAAGPDMRLVRFKRTPGYTETWLWTAETFSSSETLLLASRGTQVVGLPPVVGEDATLETEFEEISPIQNKTTQVVQPVVPRRPSKEERAQLLSPYKKN